MSKTIELLLTESVENLGIVGDVVRVRLGYARNYLLPHGMATMPSDEMIKALAEKRAKAQREHMALREQREEMATKLEGFELHIERSCNDQGVLYASVTQQEIADLLGEEGFAVRPRDVRIPHGIKRIDTYEVLLKFAADLEATIKLWIVPDRKMDADARDEMEFDDEGELIIKKKKAPRDAEAEQTEPASADA